MDIALVTHHARNYQSLADITFKNKQDYCNRYGYTAYVDIIEEHYPSIGFQKISYLQSILHKHDWLFWNGCDTLITNFNIDIATLLDNNYHFIIATDRNGINADSFLIRNSKEGHDYLATIMSHEPRYKTHYWFEQQVIIDLLPKFKDIIKVVSQRTLNSYDYNLYPPITDNKDKLGNVGQWEYSDLLIHWPGLKLQQRLELAAHYLKLIKYE